MELLFMKLLRLLTSTLLILTFLMPASVLAEVDWQARATLKTKSNPVDVAVSADGKYTFVLGEDGNLFIYTAQGDLYDTIIVNPDMDRVSVDGTGSRLLLSNNKAGTVHELLIDYVAEFTYDGSPFLGNNNAPVVVAVFSDFQ